MKLMISGSHGLVGSALVQNLQADGHHVQRLGRNLTEPIDFQDVDAVIHLAGESIAEGRWNQAKKDRIRSSRVDGTTALAAQLNASTNKPNVFISASAIGFYGDRGSESLTEESGLGTGFLPEVCIEWEQASDVEGLRVVQLRTGIVLSKEGGALKKMLTPFKMGAGGILGSGKQYMSWISLDDMVKAIRFILDTPDLEGPVNLVAPNPVTNHEFTKTLGSTLKRPTIAPMPGFAARLLFGEMADALLLSGANVLPKKLQQAGYLFKHENLADALEEILG